jgi:PKHD-type hydroxylase
MSHLPIWFLGQVAEQERSKAFDELKLIAPKEAAMGIEGDTIDSTNRDTTVRFADPGYWFGSDMFFYGIKANLDCKWGFHLDSCEAVQFAQYESSQHYNWHIDTFFLSAKDYDRKVTVICLMNDPSEFEGGKLEMRFEQKEHTVPLNKGTIVAFPSFIEHRVTPVTSGTRYTATMWVNGPRLR